MQKPREEISPSLPVSLSAHYVISDQQNKTSHLSFVKIEYAS